MFSLAYSARTNEKESRMSGEKGDLLKTVRERQLKTLSHIIGEEGLEYDALTRMIEDTRERERTKRKIHE